MCVWCELYGGGYDRWYLNPANYARRLYKIRREEAETVWIKDAPLPPGGSTVSREFIEACDRGDHETMERLKREEEQRAAVGHFGQVVTLEDALKVVDIMYPIVLMTCQCRRLMYGTPDEENFFCMGMGSGMYKWERWPDRYRGGVQVLTPEETKEVLIKMNKRGLVQGVFVFGTPYIAGLCNCDYPDCDAIRARVDYDFKLYWKGHHVAHLHPDLCNGCGNCVARCQFRAINLVPSRNKAYIDQMQCFGCGNCASICDQEAITLVERASLPALANQW